MSRGQIGQTSLGLVKARGNAARLWTTSRPSLTGPRSSAMPDISNRSKGEPASPPLALSKAIP